MPAFLHISSYAPPHGGAAQIMAEQAEAQKQLFRDEVAVVSFEPGFRYLEKKGVRVVKLRGLAVRQDWLLRMSDYRTLWHLVGNTDYVILHSPYYVVNVVTAVMARLRKKPAVCIHHGHLPSEFRNRLNITVMNWLVAAWLILDSEHKAFLKKYVRQLKPTRLIQNGLWLDRLPVLPRRSRISRFVYAGRLAEDKGMRELATAAKAFPEYQFILVGDGEGAPLFRDLPNVTLKGFLPHQQALQKMAKADCLLLPSYHETLPRVVVEAIAMQVPVIVTKVSKPLEELVEGNGLLITPQDSKALIDAIRKAVNNKLRVSEPKKVQELDWSTVMPKVREAIMSL